MDIMQTLCSIRTGDGSNVAWKGYITKQKKEEEKKCNTHDWATSLSGLRTGHSHTLWLHLDFYGLVYSLYN